MKILSLFDNVKLPVKMALIGALSIVGIALPTYYYVQLSLDNETSSRIELKGLQPATMVTQLKKAMAEHRGLSATYLSGDSSLQSQVSAKAQLVDTGLNRIEKILRERAPNSSLITSVNDITNSWEKIKSDVASLQVASKTSFDAHSSLILRSDLLIEEVSNHFLLSYDPAAASYHAIIANYKNLPHLSDALGKVRGAGAAALASGQVSSVQKANISGYLSNIVSPLQDFEHNLGAAANADSRFDSLHGDAERLKNTISQLMTMTQNEILYKSVTDYSSSQYFNQYSAAIDGLYATLDKSEALIHTIIDERLDVTANNRLSTLILVFLAIAIAVIVGFLVVTSLRTSNTRLIHFFKEISAGKYDLPFVNDRKDEMGILENELSQLTTQLADAASLSVEASKVKQALDKSSTCFMMSNSKREVAYMNDAAYRLLKSCEADIRQELPQFNIETLVGQTIDSFYQTSPENSKLLEHLGTSHKTRMNFGKKVLQVSINPIRDEAGNDLGNSLEWDELTDTLEEERRVARVLESLNSTTTNVMIANSDREILYLNRSVQTMLKDAEADLKKVLPHFDADNIIGKNMDIFHKDPSHQRQLLERLDKKFVSQIKVGARHFRLTANPISNNGERIGTVVEWLDRTKEVHAEKEIAKIVEASLAGDFTQRVDETGKEDFMLTLAQGLNQLMKTTDSGLNEVSNVLLAISEGDLSKRIDSHYQGTFNDLKNYCNTTTENLGNIISQIREASDTINNASSEIAQGNADLSTRTEQQASSLEETASSMEELTSTVRLNAENANQANGLASQAAQVAGNGGSLIQQVVTTMASINDSSNKIADIIGVIDGIAFQTNILALNAAVEAARAGEQGRGFAVVASEVRTLAQRSANAAKDIKDLISDSVSKVESGNELVSQSGDTMQEIVVSIQRVNDIMSEIAAASAEQASGIDEVSKAVTQMDEMTQQNAALVEEAAAAAESMRSQASDLNTRVGTFKINESDIVISQAQVSRPAPDALMQQFDELPSVTSTKSTSSSRAIPAISDDDEWESF